MHVQRAMCEYAGLAPPLFDRDCGQDQFLLWIFFHQFLAAG